MDVHEGQEEVLVIAHLCHVALVGWARDPNQGQRRGAFHIYVVLAKG